MIQMTNNEIEKINIACNMKKSRSIVNVKQINKKEKKQDIN